MVSVNPESKPNKPPKYGPFHTWRLGRACGAVWSISRPCVVLPLDEAQRAVRRGSSHGKCSSGHDEAPGKLRAGRGPPVLRRYPRATVARSTAADATAFSLPSVPSPRMRGLGGTGVRLCVSYAAAIAMCTNRA